MSRPTETIEMERRIAAEATRDGSHREYRWLILLAYVLSATGTYELVRITLLNHISPPAAHLVTLALIVTLALVPGFFSEVRRKRLQESRARVEQALSEERRLLRLLIDNMPDYIYVKDQKSRFVIANRAVAKLVGASDPGDLLGKTDFDFFPREIAASFFADEQEVVRSGQPLINREEANIDAEGRSKWNLTTKVPLFGENGRAIGVMGIGRDLTSRKEAEAELERAREIAEQANRSKSAFLANMSHEIRTPMNGIIGMAELALDTELTPEQCEYVTTVKTCADSLLTVINDVLDFSKIEAGKLDLDEIDFNLADVLDLSLKTLSIRADQKGLELLCDIDPGVPKTVHGDPGRLRQIIMNLVGNAVKFTERGEVQLKVRADESQDQHVLAHFTIADTGIGIAKEKRDLIFQPFSQADVSTTRKYGGTGLGLTISTRLVEIMGGRIWLQSEEGVGTQFHFTAKLRVAAAAPVTHSGASLEAIRDARILVVDDNGTNLKIVEGMLARWNMTATPVESGEAALAELAAAQKIGKPYTLILTDVLMPKMDGFQLVEEIRKNPEFSKFPTIMMLTSLGQRGDGRRCRELGVAAYLVKPIRQSELLEALAHVLGSRKQEAAGPVTQYTLREEGVASTQLRVLIVEDNPVNQRVLSRLLEKRGHAVKVKTTGREAIETVHGESYDVVFMDIQMPDMDGLEATRAIRDHERASGRHQRVIALTAHAMKGDEERCLQAGVDGYLSKPVRTAELDQVLLDCIRARSEFAEPAEAARSKR